MEHGDTAVEVGSGEYSNIRRTPVWKRSPLMMKSGKSAEVKSQNSSCRRNDVSALLYNQLSLSLLFNKRDKAPVVRPSKTESQQNLSGPSREKINSSKMSCPPDSLLLTINVLTAPPPGFVYVVTPFLPSTGTTLTPGPTTVVAVKGTIQLCADPTTEYILVQLVTTAGLPQATAPAGIVSSTSTVFTLNLCTLGNKHVPLYLLFLNAGTVPQPCPMPPKNGGTGKTELPPYNNTKPPAMGDKYYLIRYENGKSVFYKNLSKCKLRELVDKEDVDSVVKLTYADIVTAITQRVFDYHLYFEQFIMTNKATNPTAYNEALDRLMSVFSKQLVSFSSITQGPFVATSWDAVKTTFGQLNEFFFRGYTLHIAPNTRVEVVCESDQFQVFVSTGQLDFSNINVNAVPPPQVVTDIGYYNFRFRYEADNVWRFYTWQVDNRVQYVDPPLNYGPFLYTPYSEDIKSKCERR